MQTRNSGPTFDYITRTFVQEPDYLKPVRARGEALRPGMQISSFEGHLLSWLVKLSGAANILEIGTFMGYSTLWMAGSLPKDGTLTTLEFDADYAAQAQAHIGASPLADRITLHQGAALDWLKAQPKNPTWDFVFIDADKFNYANYLDEVLPRLNPRAMIVGDNSLLWGAMSGEVPDAAQPDAIEAMTRFNTTLADASRFDSILLPTIEGMTVARLK
jgi:caffeoyl-CoA O-methyltransferase